MQQKFNYQEVVMAIRDMIRKEAEMLKITVPGAIRISFEPYTEEADKLLGGLSDFRSHAENEQIPEDIALYECSFALCPAADYAMNVSSDYSDIHIKKRTLLLGNQAEGLTEKVFVFANFMDVTVRVYGAGEKNGFLASMAISAITPFFEERHSDFSLEVGR